VMMIWKRGRSLVTEALARSTMPLDEFLNTIARDVQRVPGMAVFLTRLPKDVPPVLIHHVSHIRALHQTVLLVTIVSERIPRVEARDRVTVERLPEGFYRVVVRSGFMQSTRLPALLASVRSLFADPAAQGDARGGPDLEKMTYYLGRESFLATKAGKMGRVSETVFSFLSRNAGAAHGHFGLPTDRVVELGIELDL
jgi:KUP system potassium uptake protein